MTASVQRRRRNTWLALLAAVGGLVAGIALAVAGVRTLANSTAGTIIEADDEVVADSRLPFTSTALAGTIDDDGRLTSVAAMALEPDGTGGTIAVVSASADAASGISNRLRPLNAVLEIEGPDAFLRAVEGMTGLSFDVVELLDQRRFAQLITPLGDLEAQLPVPVTDASSDEMWSAGPTFLSSSGAARLITAVDPAIDDWSVEPSRAAVWSAIAERVGAGIGTAQPVDSDLDVPVPASLDAFTDRLFAGQVESRALLFTPVDDDRIDEQLSDEMRRAFGASSVVGVVAHDRSEMVLVFGAVAPARLGAPFEAPTFRLVSGFGDDAVVDAGIDADEMNDSDLSKAAIDRLLFAKVNVISVEQDARRQPPEVTVFRVADPELVDLVASAYGEMFGESEVVIADDVIVGVDVEVELGTAFLDSVVAS